jgi:hypothetical protein
LNYSRIILEKLIEKQDGMESDDEGAILPHFLLTRPFKLRRSFFNIQRRSAIV